MTNSIGKTIRNLRKSRNLTQEELAENIGVSAQAVSKWENDLGMPDIALVVPLAHFFGVSTDCIFGISEDNKTDYIGNLIREATSMESFAEEYQTLKDALRAYPGDMRLLCELLSCGVTLLSDGDTVKGSDRDGIFEECEKAGNLIIQYCKDSALLFEATTWFVRFYCEMGDIEKSISLAERLPENILFNKSEALGRIYELKEDYQSAAEQFGKNISLYVHGLMHDLIECGNALAKCGEKSKSTETFKNAERIGITLLNLNLTASTKKNLERQIGRCRNSIELLSR